MRAVHDWAAGYHFGPEHSSGSYVSSPLEDVFGDAAHVPHCTVISDCEGSPFRLMIVTCVIATVSGLVACWDLPMETNVKSVAISHAFIKPILNKN
jgi:hypothetical protein